MSDEKLKESAESNGIDEAPAPAASPAPAPAPTNGAASNGTAKGGPPALGWFALILLILSIPVAIAWPTLIGIDDPLTKLRALGISAAVAGAVGAGLRLWAHQGDVRVDAAGKILGFIAALLAMWATAALFVFLSVTGQG